MDGTSRRLKLLFYFPSLILLFVTSFVYAKPTNHWVEKEGYLRLYEGQKKIKEIKLGDGITGGVIGVDKYAYTDRRIYIESDEATDFLFEYFDNDGKVLISKKSVIGMPLFDSRGKYVFLIECSPAAIGKSDAGDSTLFATAYAADGSSISMPTCKTSANQWSASEDGVYIYRYCHKGSPGIEEGGNFIFDTVRGHGRILKTNGGLRILSNGNYQVIKTNQDKNPKTGMYEYKTTIVSEGNLNQ